MTEFIESNNSLSSKASIISFGQLALSLSHLMAAAFLSYSLSKEDYGVFRQVWLVFHTMIPILTLGLPLSINYFIPQMKARDQKALHLQTFLILTLTGFIVSLLFFFGAPLFSLWFNNPSLTGLFRIFSLVPLLTFPTLYYQNLFVCLNKPLLAAKLSLMMAAGYLVSIVIPVLLNGSIKEIFISFTAYSFFQLIIVSSLLFRPFKNIKIQWSTSLIKKQLIYAVPLGLTAVVGILNKQLDKFVISSFFSTEQFATYINGAFEIPLIGILTGSVTAVLMPEFVRLWYNKDKEAMIKIWHSAIRKVALILYPVMFFLIAFAPEVLTLLFSSKYLDSTLVFRIYTLGLLMRITNFGMVLLSMGLSRIVFRYALWTFGLNIVLNIVLIKTIGFAGPAIATVAIIFIINYLQLRRIGIEADIPLKRLFPWRNLLELIFLSFTAAAAVFLLKSLLNFDKQIFSLILGGILFCLIFSILGILAKIVSQKDLRMPFQILKGIFKNR